MLGNNTNLRLSLTILGSLLAAGLILGGFKYGQYQLTKGRSEGYKVARQQFLNGKEGEINDKIKDAYTIGCQIATQKTLEVFGRSDAGAIAQESKAACENDASVSLPYYSLD